MYVLLVCGPAKWREHRLAFLNWSIGFPEQFSVPGIFLRDTPGKRPPCLHERIFAGNGQRGALPRAVRSMAGTGWGERNFPYPIIENCFPMKEKTLRQGAGCPLDICCAGQSGMEIALRRNERCRLSVLIPRCGRHPPIPGILNTFPAPDRSAG